MKLAQDHPLIPHRTFLYVRLSLLITLESTLIICMVAPSVEEIEESQKVEGVTLYGGNGVNVSLTFKVSEIIICTLGT